MPATFKYLLASLRAGCFPIAKQLYCEDPPRRPHERETEKQHTLLASSSGIVGEALAYSTS